MNTVKTVLLCAGVNLRKWPVNPRLYTLAAALAAFMGWHLSGLPAYAGAVGVDAAPWIFPFLFSGYIMPMVFGCFTALLFCDAPFADDHMSFLMIRSGRRNWVIGQLVYIAEAGFFYTAFMAVLSVLALLPNVALSADWGRVLRTLAFSPDSPSRYGLAMPFSVSQEFIGAFTPVQAMLASFGLFWLGTVFLGVLIFFFNVVVAKMSGLAAAGALIFVSYFSAYLGRFSLGSGIYFFSPLNWINLVYLDWNQRGGLPSPVFAVLCMLGAIAVMSAVSVKKFCDKDVIV